VLEHPRDDRCHDDQLHRGPPDGDGRLAAHRHAGETGDDDDHADQDGERERGAQHGPGGHGPARYRRARPASGVV
jgi:hypothetical protein